MDAGERTQRLELQVHAVALELGRLLESAGGRVVTVESCTGGLVARALTEAPGSSSWFDRGFVTYSNAAKEAEVGVARATLAAHGAVSEPVAVEMALGGLGRLGSPGGSGSGAGANGDRRSGVGLALSITGIAGPSGAVPGKPVGTVCFGWALRGPGSPEVLVRGSTGHFDGDRAAVRLQAALEALSGAIRLWRGELADRPPAA